MGVTEVSKLAFTRGCVLQMTCCNDALLYWIENSFFISKPFEQLEELIELICRLPISTQEGFLKPEPLLLPEIPGTATLIAA
ncbi:hypothetical protein [Leptolyngbya ohadii]|uniref:hypothetical protein n=1 Tax=Leptolyngbya ohadii TaxID=1962290 RepID=UPI00117A6887|nr:hypothetical protein [Leptolyngbya ohadii]